MSEYCGFNCNWDVDPDVNPILSYLIPIIILRNNTVAPVAPVAPELDSRRLSKTCW